MIPPSLTVNWRSIFLKSPIKTLLATTDYPPFIENHVTPTPPPLQKNPPFPGDKYCLADKALYMTLGAKWVDVNSDIKVCFPFAAFISKSLSYES